MQASFVAEHLEASLHGRLAGLDADKLELSRLISPTQARELADATSTDAPSENAFDPDSVAVVVIPNQTAFLELQQLDIPLLLVVPEGTPLIGKFPLMMVQDMRLSFARLSRLFNPRPAIAQGRHPSAIINPSARLASDVAVAAGVVIDAGVVIGKGTMIGANTSIRQGVKIGRDCRIHANVSLYDGISLGNRVEIASGVVIGADSFGYALPKDGGHAQRIAHTGTVIIENDVSIDANTVIDRGTLEVTRIGAGTKIGMLCSIAHNVAIGQDCLLVGNIGVAGSVRIGHRVQIGGKVGISDNLTIGDDVKIAGGASVINDIAAGETVFGYPAVPMRQWVRERHLQRQMKRIWAYVKRQLKSEQTE